MRYDLPRPELQSLTRTIRSSSIKPLNYAKRPYNFPGEHEVFLGQAVADLSEVTELDFEQPRALWQKVFDDAARDRYVENVTGHLSNVKVQAIKERMVAICAFPRLSSWHPWLT